MHLSRWSAISLHYMRFLCTTNLFQLPVADAKGIFSGCLLLSNTPSVCPLLLQLGFTVFLQFISHWVLDTCPNYLPINGKLNRKCHGRQRLMLYFVMCINLIFWCWISTLEQSLVPQALHCTLVWTERKMADWYQRRCITSCVQWRFLTICPYHFLLVNLHLELHRFQTKCFVQ